MRRSGGQRVVSALAGWARRFRLVNDPSTDDVVSWSADGRRCVPRPPLPHAKGRRAACARVRRASPEALPTWTGRGLLTTRCARGAAVLWCGTTRSSSARCCRVASRR